MILHNTVKLERVRGKDKWILLEDYRVTLDDGREITVPARFETDKASVPRPVWIILPRDDRYIIDAALVHDYLYTEQKIEGRWIYRKEADQILAQIAGYSGMGWFRRNMMYAGVRSGGWMYWNKHAKELGNPWYG